MKRRKFISTVGMGAAVAAISNNILSAPVNDYSLDTDIDLNSHSFPELPYSYDALEPFIDKMTMEIHYDRHHRGYFNKYVAAIKGTELEELPLAKIFARMSKHPVGVRNSGGGFYNHALFWKNMSPEKSSPSAALLKAIESSFGSLEKFKENFSKSAATRFGSGWAWLVMDADKKLVLGSTANQDNPLMDTSELKGSPLLALDVWEHAYYLKYQNKRADYIDAFWNVVNWKEVNKRFELALNA